MVQFSIRTATPEDWERIIEIYNQAVDQKFCTADIKKVTVQSRLSWFRQHSTTHYPIYVSEMNGVITGWCSLSPYRPGRGALHSVAEISFYIDKDHRRKGIADNMISHALSQAPNLGIKNLLAILLEVNEASIGLLEKHGFIRWGHFPDIADFDGKVCGQYIYGKKVRK